jgi:hypothetical protein
VELQFKVRQHFRQIKMPCSRKQFSLPPRFIGLPADR